MTEYALFFETGGPVFGQGYVALVTVRGRLLAVRTPDDFDLYGVNPGGAAVHGPTLNEAFIGAKAISGLSAAVRPPAPHHWPA